MNRKNNCDAHEHNCTLRPNETPVVATPDVPIVENIKVTEKAKKSMGKKTVETGC